MTESERQFRKARREAATAAYDLYGVAVAEQVRKAKTLGEINRIMTTHRKEI